MSLLDYNPIFDFARPIGLVIPKEHISNSTALSSAVVV